MINGRDKFSPQAYARIAGLLYLIVIAAGIYAEMVVREPMIVHNNAAATANNILAHEGMFRMGFAAELIAGLCNIPLALIFYELFKVVNRRVVLLVIFFSLVGTGIESMNLLYHFAPIIFLHGVSGLGADQVQMQIQAYLSLKLQSTGFAIALTYFGGFCISLGYLIFKSSFMPKFIGVLLAIEGVCYLVNSFTDFLVPQLSAVVFSFLALSAIAEVVLSLWLLMKGIDLQKWEEAAGLEPAGIVGKQGPG